jgi:hypothetical protein
LNFARTFFTKCSQNNCVKYKLVLVLNVVTCFLLSTKFSFLDFEIISKLECLHQFCVFFGFIYPIECFFFRWYILRLGFILCKIWNHLKVFNKSNFFSLQIIISLCNFTVFITLGSSFVCVNFQQFALFFDVWLFLCGVGV